MNNEKNNNFNPQNYNENNEHQYNQNGYYDENGNYVELNGYYDNQGNFYTQNGYYDQQGNFFPYSNNYYDDFRTQENYVEQNNNGYENPVTYNTQNHSKNTNYNGHPNFIPPHTDNQYNNQQFTSPDGYNNKKKKSIVPIILASIITFAVLVVGLYFGYTKFIKKEAIIDLSKYEVNFVTYGAEGDGKPEVDIKKVPDVNNTTSEISNFLANPDVSFDKKNGLKNGDNVEVTITLNKNTAKKLNLKTTGEFKRQFTVNGLNEKTKEKETIIVKDKSSSSSNNSKLSEERTVYVKPTEGVNLRSSANDSSSILTTIKVGQRISQHYIEENSNGEKWAYVTYNGKNGWIRADLLG